MWCSTITRARRRRGSRWGLESAEPQPNGEFPRRRGGAEGGKEGIFSTGLTGWEGARVPIGWGEFNAEVEEEKMCAARGNFRGLLCRDAEKKVIQISGLRMDRGFFCANSVFLNRGVCGTMIGTYEPSTHIGGDEKGGVHPEFGWETGGVGNQRAAFCGVGDLSSQRIAGQSGPIVCVAIERVVWAGDPTV